ncbi:MAG: hypothetical protein ACK4TA_09875 [Saprospiraceae bacterium]
MSLENIIENVKQWNQLQQKLFLYRIAKDIPIMIRGIWVSEDINCQEKLEAIKWINEFHHRIDNLIFDINQGLDNQKNMELFFKHVIHYSKENLRTKQDIEWLINNSYDLIKLEIVKPVATPNQSNLLDFINNSLFREKTAMYLGEKRLSTLQALIHGYYLAYGANPNNNIFKGFDDWIAKYYGWQESTAGWKNIIVEECKSDEEKAVDEFFKVFDKFKSDI